MSECINVLPYLELAWSFDTLPPKPDPPWPCPPLKAGWQGDRLAVCSVESGLAGSWMNFVLSVCLPLNGRILWLLPSTNLLEEEWIWVQEHVCVSGSVSVVWRWYGMWAHKTRHVCVFECVWKGVHAHISVPEGLAGCWWARVHVVKPVSIFQVWVCVFGV